MKSPNKSLAVEIRALGERDKDFFVVPLIFTEEGLILDMIEPQRQWCFEYCQEAFTPDLCETEGFVMLFVNRDDALAYKMRWY